MAGLTPTIGFEPQRPVLDLSGPKLRAAFETLANASERVGGLERFAEAVKLKAGAFHQRLGEGRAANLDRPDFEELVLLMATVRRRIGPLFERSGWPGLRAAINDLLEGAHDTATADRRIARFESALCTPGGRLARGETPGPRQTRFLRDLAAEILHNVLPEHYPLMHRWVWDANTNTGALREIWHGDNVDAMVIDVPDGYETFLMLREELSQFLAENGVFRDMLWHVDLLLAQVYATYINAQGGAWLKTDFGSESDPLEHTLRIVGLDRVTGKPGKDKTLDGSADTLSDPKLLS
ncbi:MAG: hypothetical protein AB7O43_04645 [Hyphomicrobiaceae bacterium]